MEGHRADPGGLPERGLRRSDPSASGMSDVWPVPRPPGRRGLTQVAAGSASAASNTPDPAVVSGALGVELRDDLVLLALTHRSFAYENGGLPTNERLEFLGDSVLGVIVTDVLYRTHPDLPEGRLAKLRASVVNMHALAGVGRQMGLGDQLRLGRGEELTGGRDKSSIVADAVEAVIGAVYLQHGLDVTRGVIHRLFGDLLTAAPQLGAGLDWKTSLQELSAGRGLGVPEYRVSEQGPDHAKVFAATVMLRGAPHGSGTGRTKKEAEQEAAAATYTSLQTAASGNGAATSSKSDATGAPAPVGVTIQTAATLLDPPAAEPADAAAGIGSADVDRAPGFEPAPTAGDTAGGAPPAPRPGA